MNGARGKIFRYTSEPQWQTLWLRRDEALFADAEWSWVAAADEAWIFDAWEDAEAKVAEYKLEGVAHVHAFVYGSTAMQEQAERQGDRQRREADAVRTFRRSVSPADAYASLEKRHLD